MDPVHTFPERYVNDYGQFHMPLTDGLSVKYVSLKIYFVFHLNSMQIGEIVVILKIHPVSLNSNGKAKCFLMTYLTDSCPSIKGR